MGARWQSTVHSRRSVGAGYIGWVGAVRGRTKISDGQWHDVAVTWQQSDASVRLYVDGQLDGQGTLRPQNRANQQVVHLGYTSTNFPTEKTLRIEAN
ncbi:MAG: LamG-like jellyroll fold domain-containing protein [Pirellulaceae bacterium]